MSSFTFVKISETFWQPDTTAHWAPPLAFTSGKIRDTQSDTQHSDIEAWTIQILKGKFQNVKYFQNRNDHLNHLTLLCTCCLHIENF